jgi:DNA helicase-2/ATP-dependent DNA helicase PcrA
MSNERKPSPFQQAIYDFVEKPHAGNATVRAVAGSGKTTTLVGAAQRTTGECVFLAFNKSIATELAQRLPSHFQARTFHSLCYNPVLRAIGARKVDADKISSLCFQHLTKEMGRMYGSFVKKLVGLARNAGVGCLIPDEAQAWMDIVEHHMISLDNDDATLEEGIRFAREILSRSNASPLVDFDDLLYFSVMKRVNLPKFDWVFVDEAQDTNAIQRAILRKILKPGGRLIAVGDPAQAIYGFRGADSNSMALIAEEFSPCVELPLSVTYRCARSIVEYAQDFVADIQPRDGAPEGSVQALEEAWKLSDLGAHDLVVCRNTLPLIDLGWKLMSARIPLRILGRDIGEGLISLIKKCDKRGGDIDAMAERLEVWRDREVAKYSKKGQEALAEATEDKANAVLMLANELPEAKRTVTELIRVINELFTDQNSRITLATVHKAKGLEADKVWWLGRSLCPSRWAKQEWQQEQERNIMYVAITRAKSTLNMIETTKTLSAGKRRQQQEAA